MIVLTMGVTRLTLSTLPRFSGGEDEKCVAISHIMHHACSRMGKDPKVLAKRRRTREESIAAE